MDKLILLIKGFALLGIVGLLSSCGGGGGGGGGGGDVSANQMEFVVTVPANTPLEDTIYLQAGVNWRSVFQMENIGNRMWRVRISESALIERQVVLGGPGTRELSYAYSRGVDANSYSGGEFFDDDPFVDAWSEHRVVNFTEGSIHEDTVQRWRFSPKDGEILPTMSAQLTTFEPRLNGLEFQAGVQINDFWPAAVPTGTSSGFDPGIDSTSQAIGNVRASWVQIAPAWDYEQIMPTPILKPFPGGSYPEAGLRAHIRNLKAHGYKVFLLLQTAVTSPRTHLPRAWMRMRHGGMPGMLKLRILFFSMRYWPRKKA